jgi:anti-sigma-K factor RskA
MTVSHDDVRDLAAGFVLGALSGEEDAAVREHLSSCTQPHPEIEELGGVVPYLAESLEPVEPPAGLRARILAAAAAERPAAGATEQPAAIQRPAAATTVDRAATPPAPTAPAEPVAFPSAAERAARASGRADRSTSVGTWVMRIAAVLAIAALGAWNLQLQGRLTGVEDDLAAATAYQQGVANVLAVASQDGAAVAILAPADPSSVARGLAATSPDGRVVLSMHDLEPTSGTEVYEAWVIVGDADPVPLGGFAVGDNGTGVFEASTDLADAGTILALTLEPAPGATTPTAPVLTVGALTADS